MSDLREIILLIEVHDARHPDHGVDCACMDSFIQKVRHLTLSISGPASKAQRRIDHVLRKAMEYRV